MKTLIGWPDPATRWTQSGLNPSRFNLLLSETPLKLFRSCLSSALAFRSASTHRSAFLAPLNRSALSCPQISSNFNWHSALTHHQLGENRDGPLFHSFFLSLDLVHDFIDLSFLLLVPCSPALFVSFYLLISVCRALTNIVIFSGMLIILYHSLLIIFLLYFLVMPV